VAAREPPCRGVGPLKAVIDTSILVAYEADGSGAEIEDGSVLSAMTIAELAHGVRAAQDHRSRERRARTLCTAERRFAVVPFTRRAAHRYGELVALARTSGRRPAVSDAVIAATAIDLGLPVVTRDADFLVFDGLEVVLV